MISSDPARHLCWAIACVLQVMLLWRGGCLLAQQEQPAGLVERLPWTTSRVVGSPEPPLPYTVEKTFENIAWRAPLYVVAEPATAWLLVVHQGEDSARPSTVVRLRDDPAASETQTLLEMGERLVYSVAFHPDYEQNGFLYVFSNGPGEPTGRSNRISRFSVGRQPPHACDPKSELVILQWRSEGHDGGDMVFGHDGMLYITSGDGTSDSDTWITGQDVRDLLGGVLRIDVDHPDKNRPYSVPKDNPFVGVADARDELWAYGLRNPWRMCVDRVTGQIWVGNNGQDLWETAHLLGRGDNYGWSVYEGNHPFYLHRQLGPTPFVPPTIEHHHREFRSLTGGVVYYGEPLAELAGAYVYGDYSTGKIWGARHDGTRLTWHQELADTSLQIAGFGITHTGQLLVVDHGAGLYRLAPAPPQPDRPKFPSRLSETGLFNSTEAHQLQPGVLPYSVNAPAWMDGARAERYLAVPGDAKIGYAARGGWSFPDGTVLMQTLWIDRSTPASAESTGLASARRVETRILTRQQGEWAGYSYRWNKAQTDATLVPRQGADIELAFADDGRQRRQPWRFPSRAECMTCHSRAAGFVLGISQLQMNRHRAYGEIRAHQLHTLEAIGMFQDPLPEDVETSARLVDPYGAEEDLELRVRSYLHTNCSVCHVEAGGGNARMELAFHTPAQQMKLIGAYPQHDTFGVANARLVMPGAPDRSILYQRISRRGRGQMPPLVSMVVDQVAVELFRDWIADLKPQRKLVRQWRLEELLPSLHKLESGRSFASGKKAFAELGCLECHRFSGQGGGAGPDLSGVAKRLTPQELLESLLAPSAKVAAQYATTVVQTFAGEVVEGRVETENDTTLVLRTADSFAQPRQVLKKEIEARFLTNQSIMPAGLLDTLEEKQLLDLLAYLLADGSEQHAIFRDPTQRGQPPTPPPGLVPGERTSENYSLPPN